MHRNHLHKGQFFAARLATDMADPVLILPDGERISFSNLIVIDDNMTQIQSFKKIEPYFVTANLSFMHLIIYTRYNTTENLHPIFHKGEDGLEEICFAIVNHMSRTGLWPDADELHDTLKTAATINSLITLEVDVFTSDSPGPDFTTGSPRSFRTPSPDLHSDTGEESAAINAPKTPPPGRRGSDASIDTASTHGTPG